MSVLINLLPDVRQARIAAERSKRTAGVVTFLVCGAAIGGVILLAVTVAGQRLAITGMTRGITYKHAQLTSQAELLPALTAQEHLASLPGLYDQRVHLSKFFQALQGATPTDVSIASLAVDQQNKIRFNGTAKSYAAAAKFARALGASGVKVGPDAKADGQPRFTGVTIESTSGESGGRVSFTMTAIMDGGVTSGRN